MSSTKTVIEFAQRSGGVFTTQEAAALGMSKSALARRVSQGIFVRVGRGVLSLPGTSTRPDLIMRAAHRTLGAVVSHESAAVRVGLGPIVVRVPTMTVSHRSTHSYPGIKVYQTTDLMEGHLTTVEGLPTTMPERTVVDLSRTTSPTRLRRIVETGLASGVIDIDVLTDLHHSLARKGKPGIRKLRQVLEAIGGQTPISDTELEARLIQLLVGSGLPEPVRQFQTPWLKKLNGRVDLAYPHQQLVIEADSRRWHVLYHAFEEDRRRDNAAQLAGWRVLRFTWRMIMDEPSQVVDVVRRALAHGSPPIPERVGRA
jgi:very-short-patch-repair endonuclease